MPEPDVDAVRVIVATKVLRSEALTIADLEMIENAIDERVYQLVGKRWTAEHDDEHTKGEIALAAACYATPPWSREGSDCGPTGLEGVPSDWPWERSGWKPTADRLQEIQKALGLLVAEGARLIRAERANGA